MRRQTHNSGMFLVSLLMASFVGFFLFRAYERHTRRIAAQVAADLIDVRFPRGM